MVTAQRLCPQAIILPVDGERYREASDLMFQILDEFSPVIEPISIDEAFLDLTGTERLQGDAEGVARRLKDRVKSDLKLTASVGVAPNKFLAKLASDMNKPDGLMVIRPEDVDGILPPLPVTRLWGIGKATAAKLEKFGIKTVGDLQRRPIEWLKRYLGTEAEHYLNLSRGIDDRPVIPDREAKSIGHEQTFEVDVASADDVRRVLLDQVEQVGHRLRKHGLHACSLSVKIRYGDFKTITRSMTFDSPTDTPMEIWQAARGLFDKWSFQPVRLIGATAERLTKGKDQMLFDDPKKKRHQQLDFVADRINEKYGTRTIRRGGKSCHDGTR